MTRFCALFSIFQPGIVRTITHSQVGVPEYGATIDDLMPHKNPEARREYDRKRRELKRLLKTDPKAAAVKEKELEKEKVARRTNAINARKASREMSPKAPARPRRRKSRDPEREARLRAEEIRAKGRRICGEEACTTVLSVYNTEDYCAIHAPSHNRDIKVFL